MQKNGRQTIKCDVTSCQHQMADECMCSLSGIKVAPKKDCCSQQSDESLCSSYKCRNCN